MSVALSLKPRVFRTYDADAATYISAVESADGQTLEQGVKEAITEFIIGCKIRGIWNAIKSCCLLCGARTIAGATIPLKGNAPVLTSFVGDYNRETGLRRTSGAFSINRNNNTDPQNNKHVAIYANNIEYGANDSTFRSLLANATTSGSTFFAVNSLGINIRVNTSANIVTTQPIISGNLVGVSVLNSSQSQLLYNNQVNIISITTTTPTSGDLSLFGGSGVSASTASRIAFYSVGESLDLRLLQQLVDIFNNRLWQTFRYNMTDSNAASYVSRVEVADASYLPNGVRLAIDNFVIGCKSDNIWNSIKTSCILCGPKTINGILVPLVGNIPTNFFFNNSDYFRGGSTIGLRGNGSNRYLNSNRAYNTDPQNNQHMSIYITVADSKAQALGTTVYMGSGSSTGAGIIGKDGTNSRIYFRHQNATAYTTNVAASGVTGLLGISRNNSTNYNFRINGSTSQYAQVSEVPDSNNVSIFALPNATFYTNGTLAFYSIGEALDLSLLDSRVTSLISSISSVL